MQLIELIAQCHSADPEARPRFTALCSTLSSLLDQQNAVLPPARDIGRLAYEGPGAFTDQAKPSTTTAATAATAAGKSSSKKRTAKGSDDKKDGCVLA